MVMDVTLLWDRHETLVTTTLMNSPEQGSNF